jgi:RHS repeat-associated protein
MALAQVGLSKQLKISIIIKINNVMKQLFILMLFFTSVSFSQTFEDVCWMSFMYNDVITNEHEDYDFEITSNQQTIRVYVGFLNQDCGAFVVNDVIPDASWVTYTYNSNYIEINILRNNTISSRSASVSVELELMSNSGSLISSSFVLTQAKDPNVKYYYTDTDGDTFGDFNALPVISDQPISGKVDNNDDYCPNEYSLANNGCLEPYEKEINWIKSKTFAINGTLKAKSKTYYNGLGKSIQSQALDVKTGRTWATQTLYDSQGRPALNTLSAPVKEAGPFEYTSEFIKNADNKPYSNADFESNIENPAFVGTEPNTLGRYYSTYNTTVEADLDPTRKKGNSYQDITKRPYSRTIYSTLNPGSVLKTIGGNKVDTDNDGDIDEDDDWLQPYSFSMPASQELSQANAFNSTAYNSPDNRKIMKTVVRDVHGIENVIFTDTDGKTLAAARSGGDDQRTMTINIGVQGYVDVHVPAGTSGSKLNSVANAKVYNLITESTVTNINANYALPAGNFYRIEGTSGSVTYKENYYDYSLNSYDNVGRLISSKQPLEHLESTYAYNALGQLLTTTSPDEGTANFVYRNDGQIRFSQNSKQQQDNEYSYTNYDSFGRPIESGVVQGTFSLTMNGDSNNSFSGSRSEQNFTQYDALAANELSGLSGLNAAYHHPSFLATNVAKTHNNQNTSYYSYDVYGRVEWILQDIEGLLGIKTIDYEYDPITSQVNKVIYQKHTPNQFFAHRYRYDATDNTLVKVETSTNNSAYTTHASYDYYETGALKRTELANGIQGIDYVYNLAGQLKAINHPSLHEDNDPGQDTNDLFGMRIDYYKGDYKRSTLFNALTAGANQYNGNIKGIAWNTDYSLGNNPVKYSYEYNRNNWLTGATFNANGNTQSIDEDVVIDYVADPNATIQATNSITFTHDAHITASGNSVFTAKIVAQDGPDPFGTTDYQVSNITYDANGNIQTLNRNKNTENGSNRMDELTYDYKTDKPNQLKRVDDAVLIATNANDIKDQTTENNYIYNSIGQLIENKDEKVKYAYNASGLVTEVQKNGTPRVRFFYDDRGHRIKKESILPSGTTTTHYVRDAAGSPLAIYENQALKEHPIYGASRLGVHYRQTNTDVYQLTDHLGNVRAVIMKNGENAVSLTSKTDYYPFGMPMPNRNVEGNYRYGYQGEFAEKDEETGLNAFQLRMYDARIGRWLVPDPKNEFFSPYLAMGNNPIVIIDPTGGVTSGGGCPDPPCDGAGNVLLNEVVITGHNPGSRGWSELIGRLSNLAQQTGATIGVFTLNALGTQANNNVTFGLHALPDPSNFGDYEGAARFGRLAGNINSIIQGASEDIGAVGGEILTVGIATPVAVPLAIHGTAVAVAGSVGTAREISGLVNYFSKRGTHNSGKGDPIPKGFKETKEFGTSHGQKIYKKGEKYISRDVGMKGGGSHNGGVWKLFKKVGNKLKRIGTLDANLNIIKD